MSKLTCEQFIKYFYPALIGQENTSAYKRECAIFNTANSRLEKFSPDTDYTKEQLLNLFADIKITSTSQFAVYRAALCHIIEYNRYTFTTIYNFKSIEYSDVSTEYHFDVSYWPSVDVITSTINAIGITYGLNVLNVRLICELLWFGFKPGEITKLKITYVDSDNNTIKFNSREYPVDKNTIRDIKSLTSKTTHNGLDIFISKRSDKISDGAIRKQLSVISQYSEETGKKFSCIDIFNSGLFSRVYDGVEELPNKSDLKEKYNGWIKRYKDGDK